MSALRRRRKISDRSPGVYPSPLCSRNVIRASRYFRVREILGGPHNSMREPRRAEEAKWNRRDGEKERERAVSHRRRDHRKRTRLKGWGEKGESTERPLPRDRERCLQPHDFHEEAVEILPMSYNNFSPRYCLF